MVDVFREVRRVLRDDGTLWLNLGDSYATSAAGNKTPSGISQATPKRNGRLDEYNSVTRDWSAMGLKQKDLIGVPWMVAFALRADGWYLRSDIIWNKPNPMPESVTDRPTKSHEYVFLLTKSAQYYYDADAIREPHAEMLREQSEKRRAQRMRRDVASVAGRGQSSKGIDSGDVETEHVMETNPAGRNKRSVWTVTTQPYPEAHFATFPEALIEPCILAGSMPWSYDSQHHASRTTVLDPFCGSGTTGAVAIRHQRNFIGVELNAEYVELAKLRIGGVAPLFTESE